MITIAQHSEFVQNLIAADPVPAANRFVAIRDQNNQPAVFSHSQDNKLELIAQVNGVPQLIDFGAWYNITGPVQAFTAKQDPHGSICVAVATQAGTSSILWILYGLSVTELTTAGTGKIARSNGTIPLIFDIFMSDFTSTISGIDLPVMFLAFQPVGSISNESQLGFVDYTIDPAHLPILSINSAWRLETDPSQILDTTFIQTERLGRAAVVLYKSAVGLRMQLRTFDLDVADFAVEVQCPSGATSLSSFLAPGDQNSQVLVGGDQITVFTYDQYTQAYAQGTAITSGSSLGIKDMHVTTGSNNLCLWYTNVDDGAFYYTANLASISQGNLVQLLPVGQGGRLSGILATASTTTSTLMKSLVSVDEFGDLSLLQQASDTGMWETHPIYIASDTNNIYVPSFTVRLQAITDQGTQDPKEVSNSCKLHVKSSGAVSVIVNGTRSTITEDGAWYDCDATGTLTYIISTADMSCHTITVDQFLASGQADPMSVTSPTLDPTATRNRDPRIQILNNPASILRAKTQGNNFRFLVPPGSASDADLNNASKCFPPLSTTPLPPTDHIAWTKLQHRTGQSCQNPLVDKDIISQAPREIGDGNGSLWDFFHHLYEAAKEVEEFAVELHGDIRHLVITWKQIGYRFILDSGAAIGKALSWVFKRLGVLVKDMIDFIGFVFEWDDIVTTAKSISSIINSAMVYGSNKISTVEDQTDAWMAIIKKGVAQKTKPANLADGSNTTQSGQSVYTSSSQHGVGPNFAGYHLQHSGFQTRSTVQDSSTTLATQKTVTKLVSGQSNDDPDPNADAQKIWQSISAEGDTIKTLVEGLYNDVGSFFTTKTNTDEIWNRVTADIETAALDTLQNLIDLVLRGGKLLVDVVYKAMTTTINVPVFTALWKDILPGQPFNILNAVSFMISISATIFHKAATGVAPPDVASRVSVDTITQFYSGDKGMDSQLRADLVKVMEVTGIAVMGLAGVFESMMLLSDEVLPADSESKNDIRSTDGSLRSSPLVGNITDTAFFVLMSGGIMATNPQTYTDNLPSRWVVYSMDLIDLITLGLSRWVGSIAGIPRVETKRVRGVVEFVTCIPRLVFRMLIDVDELYTTSSQKTWQHDGAIMQTTADACDLPGTWAFAVAALTDGYKDPVSLTAFTAGFSGMVVLLGAEYGLLLSKFIYTEIEKRKDPPSLQAMVTRKAERLTTKVVSITQRELAQEVL